MSPEKALLTLWTQMPYGADSNSKLHEQHYSNITVIALCSFCDTNITLKQKEYLSYSNSTIYDPKSQACAHANTILQF